jgi:hypothetical protein
VLSLHFRLRGRNTRQVPSPADRATVFGSGQTQQIAQCPEKGHLRIGIQKMLFAFTIRVKTDISTPQ